MTVPTPPMQAPTPPQPPTLNYQMGNAPYSQNNKNLAGTLIALSIYQIVQTVFYCFIFLIVLIAAFSSDDESGVLYLPRIIRILMVFIVLAILITFVMSTIFIFMKKRIGIKFSYSVVALQVLMVVFFIVAKIYQVETNIDIIADDDPYRIGATIAIVVVCAIFWALHFLLLMLPVSKRNVRETFK